jgi:hypothetical protein
MSLVVVGHGPGPALLQGKTWLGAIQGLDLRLLIDAEDDGVSWRIDIKADDVADLGRKIGIVGQLEGSDAVRAKPWARQMRCTEVRLTRAILAITRPVQGVISPGGSPRGRATIRSATSSASLGTRAGRVLSCSSPGTPSSMNRACQRQTAVLLTPAVRMIAAVPSQSAVASTIRAR